MPKPEATKLDRWIERGNRGVGCGHLGGRRAIHEHVDVELHEPGSGEDHEEGHEERGDTVRPWIARAGRDQAARDRDRAREVAAEMEGVRHQRRAVVAARRAERDDRP